MTYILHTGMRKCYVYVALSLVHKSSGGKGQQNFCMNTKIHKKISPVWKMVMGEAHETGYIQYNEASWDFSLCKLIMDNT